MPSRQLLAAGCPTFRLFNPPTDKARGIVQLLASVDGIDFTQPGIHEIYVPEAQFRTHPGAIIIRAASLDTPGSQSAIISFGRNATDYNNFVQPFALLGFNAGGEWRIPLQGRMPAPMGEASVDPFVMKIVTASDNAELFANVMLEGMVL